MVLPVTKLITADEFEAFIARPEHSDRLFELVNGEIIEKMPTEEHGIVQGNFYAALREFARHRGLGRTVLEVRYRAADDNYNTRMPDVAFTRTERLQPVVTRGAATQLPDIAVEVQSPDDSLTKMREKAAYLLSKGVSLVWLALPRKRLIEVYRADGSADILTAEDVLDAGEILPEFGVAVASLFEE